MIDFVHDQAALGVFEQIDRDDAAADGLRRCNGNAIKLRRHFAVAGFAAEVREGKFPDADHSYGMKPEEQAALEAMLAKAGDGGEGEAPGTPERREEPSSERDARLARPATDAMA